jgi:phage terminase large subunit-like protein
VSDLEAQLRRLLAALGPEGGRLALEMSLDECSPTELAALLYDWRTWARPGQRLPSGGWRSALLKCGRGWGKTRAVVEYALEQIANNPTVRHVALVGPTDDQVVALLVAGDDGFLGLCPPWLGVTYEKASMRLVFGNGVVASLYSAQTPTRLRGPTHQLALCTELAFWPESTREKTFSNMQFSTRTGDGRYLVDTTPEDDHPLIDRMLAEHAADPTKHLLIEGATEENALNLSAGIVKEWRAANRGTDAEANELDGEYRNEAPNRVFKRASVERSLRGGLSKYSRRIVSVDPATAGKKYNDAVGIIELGLEAGDVYVLRNAGGKMSAEEWPDVVLDVYRDGRCDLLAIELDHGSTVWPRVFSDGCKLRGWQFVRVEEGAICRHVPGQLNFYGFHVGNRQSKRERARAAGAWLDRGRVHLVRGALGNLEKQMYSFTGADGRPDDAVDGMVNGVMVLGLTDDAIPGMRPGDGAALLEIQAALSAPGPATRLGSGSEFVSDGGVMLRRTNAERAQGGNLSSSIAIAFRGPRSKTWPGAF